MKRLTFINESQRDWHAFTPSDSKYSIEWNSRNGVVRVSTSFEQISFSKPGVKASNVLTVGEAMVPEHLIHRREFNAPIPIIKLG